VFISTFAVFAPGRCFDQLRLGIAQPRLNVKLVASHAGIITGEDGASAHAIDDLALMLSLPGFRVIVPADVVEAEQAIEVAARTYGPFYVRCVRPKIPVIHDEGYKFQLGKARLMRPGKDVTVMAVGVMVWKALEAAELLAAEGIDCRVLNMASLKPLDVEVMLAAARETGAIVTAEDHLVHGGLASLVAQTLALHQPTPMAFIGMQDQYAVSGRWDQLLEHYGLTAEKIAEAARSVLARKGR
jgi:transketolase